MSSLLLEIGDSYDWGSGISTTITGFFFTSESRQDVALTVIPPHKSSRYTPVGNSLLCYATLKHCKYSNTLQGRDSPYKSISSAVPRFGEQCAIYKRNRAISAEVVGTHRSLRIGGQIFHELFEFETPDSLAGFAGAPVVVASELVGVVVATPQKSGGNVGFFLSTSSLVDRLTLLPRCHASDTAEVGKFVNMLATFRELEEMA